jgi:3-methyladenine DNA glycosylase/8-oxoguanine DNA glycosylase
MRALRTFSLPVQKPFDWQSLLAFLRVRATPGVETVTDSDYSRTVADGSAPQTLSVRFDQTAATLKVSYSGKADMRREIDQQIRQLFRTDLSTLPIEASLGRDPWLARFVRQQPGLRVPGGWSAFEVAARAILGQQISVPAATTLMGRLVRSAGTRLTETAWLFPTPKQVLEADLSNLGVPRSRLQTLKSLAAFFAELGDHCVQQPDVRARLLTIQGIGPWTAGYILMRTGTGHDHWPEGDLVLRKALSKNKILMAPARMEQAFRRWSPYRAYATIHIWRGYVSRTN